MTILIQSTSPGTQVKTTYMVFIFYNWNIDNSFSVSEQPDPIFIYLNTINNNICTAVLKSINNGTIAFINTSCDHNPTPLEIANNSSFFRPLP
ncbi:hypothetical protein CDAR_593001 [Caerostris darwini]|uniref:Uncharacterized protein n=1 Tax=Caerostris darwini TaxID=1538125 RepID=A0AAV4MD26_9ARAC|nr:hypothetical protein CDAR_593001 [Caerostris darwini]